MEAFSVNICHIMTPVRGALFLTSCARTTFFLDENMPAVYTKDMNTHRLTRLSLCTACSLIVYMIEAALPPITSIPGIKPGLSHVVTLFVLLRFSKKDACLVLLMRIILASIFGGQAVSFVYALSGGVLCILGMSLIQWFLYPKKTVSAQFTPPLYAVLCISITGALCHNAGQLLAAWAFTGTSGVFLYLPYLAISACITGLFTGLCAYYVGKLLPRGTGSSES